MYNFFKPVSEDLDDSVLKDLVVSVIETYSRSQNCSCRSSFSPFNARYLITLFYIYHNKVVVHVKLLPRFKTLTIY